jgi:hypothetical protein
MIMKRKLWKKEEKEKKGSLYNITGSGGQAAE